MQQPASKSDYTVYVDDNFHYQDETERYRLGSYNTCDDAMAACRRIVDRFLSQNHKPGMSAAELFKAYTNFGEDPYITVANGAIPCSFSAWNYARERCNFYAQPSFHDEQNLL